MIAAKKPRGLYFHIHGGGWSIGAPTTRTIRAGTLRRRLRALPACRSTTGSRRSTPIRRAPTIARRRRSGSCAKAQSVSARHASRSAANPPAGIFPPSRCCGCATGTGSRRSRAAILNYGCFDIGMTPSARRWGEEKLVLNTPAIVAFRKCFLPAGTDMSDPDVSPLYADLRGHAGCALLGRHARCAARRFAVHGAALARRRQCRRACALSGRLPRLPEPADFPQRNEAVARIESVRCSAICERQILSLPGVFCIMSTRRRHIFSNALITRSISASLGSGTFRLSSRCDCRTARSRRRPAAAGRAPACPS